MTLSQFLKAYREEHHISMRRFAEMAGISHSLVSILERDLNGREDKQKMSPSIDTLNRIASVMGITFEELVRSCDDIDIELEEEAVVDIPILGSVAAGFDKWAIHEFGKMEIQKAWLHGRSPKEFFLLRVTGDSMIPDYQDGDFVLCLTTSDMGRSGKVGVVVDSYGEATLKKINYPMHGDPEFGKWMELEPLNPKYEKRRIEGSDLETYYVQGRVMMVIREVDRP